MTVPLALYSDRRIFQRSPKEPESSCRAARDPTQFGRAPGRAIRLIMAHTPQAKGRIERVWGTFQDRLVSEMRLAGASNRPGQQRARRLPAALQQTSTRGRAGLGLPPAPRRPLPQCRLCFKYIRTVANDNTARFNGHTLRSYPMSTEPYAHSGGPGTHVDGTIVGVQQARTLAIEPAPHGPIEIRARSGRRPNGHPLPDGADRAPMAPTLTPYERPSEEPTGWRTPPLNQDQHPLPKDTGSRPPLTDIIIHLP